MNQLNNILTPKGRKVFSRRILFFSFFILAVVALALGLWLKMEWIANIFIGIMEFWKLYVLKILFML